MDSAVVFDAIKRMSKKTLNSQHRILLNDIVMELKSSDDELVLLLSELVAAGLIKLHRSKVISVSLTNYGLSQSAV